MYLCSYTNCNHRYVTRREFHSHIYSHIQNNNLLKCPYYLICQNEKLFNNVNTLKTHIHRDHCHDEMNPDPDEQPLFKLKQKITEKDETNLQLLPELSFEEKSLDLLANLYATLKAKYFIPENHVDTIISTYMELNHINDEYLLSKVKDEERKYTSNLLSNNLFFKAHNKENGPLRNSYQRQQFFRNHFPYIDPVSVILRAEDNTSYCYYIPVLETLEALLSDIDVLNQCLNKESRFDGARFSDLNTGKRSNKISDDFNNENVIKITLYQDAFEICNPLGSSKKNIKLSGFI